MAASLNKVMLIGNLGRAPEIRHTQAGALIVQLSVATSETWKDKATGERRERTEWHRVVIFNEKLAEVAQQYLRKGAKLYLEGQMQTRKWTDQSGVEKYTTEVVLPRFGGLLTMLDSQRSGPPPAGSPDDYGRDTTRPHGDAAAPPGQSTAGELDDDIPF